MIVNHIPAPLIPEPGMSDPHALVIDDVCYLFTSHDVGFGVSDWIMPDWRIHRSEDLQQWAHVGTISPADNYMGAGNTHCWAGDIAARNGRFYWYFSNHDKESGIMVADRPEGPYTDALGGPLVDSFDPSVFMEDGTAYILYGQNPYCIARLKDSMVALDEAPRRIEFDFQGDFPNVDKGSLHKHNDTYYLSCSSYYATSSSVYGPYTYRGRVGSDFGLNTNFAHGDFFVWKGQWFHTWCQYRDLRHDKVRDCYMAPVSYGPDGSMKTETDFLGRQ